MLGVVVQIDGYDPGAGAPVSLRAASHDLAEVCHVDGGAVFWPAIAKLPKLRYDFFDGAFEGKIAAPSSSIELATEAWPAFGRYALADARFRLWTGEAGAPWSAWTQRVDARVTQQPTGEDGRATVDFAVDDRWLDRALLATYAGTTGIEGPAALKGQPKPLALGAPRYAAGVLVDPINSVFQLSAYGAIGAVEAALERLARFGASAGDFPSYDALVAAAIPPGRWATCLASGLVRFGAPPSGQVSFLLQGDVAGPYGWARRPGALIRRLALLSGGAGRLDDATLTALDAARPYNGSLYLDQQTSARDLIQELAASVNAVAGVSWMGKLFVLPVAIGAAALTLATDGSSLPPTAPAAQLEIAPPFGKLAITAERTWTVHPLGDVAFTAQLVDLGAYAAGTTYREGNIVQYQGSSWLYVNVTPSSGNAPPALPTESDAFWKVLARAGEDGVNGKDALVAYLTNEAHNVPADPAGNVTSYTGASTTIVIMSGSSDVTSLFSYVYDDPGTQNPQGLSVTGAYPTFSVDGGFDAGEGAATFTFRAVGKSGTTFAGKQVAATFSLAKVPAGADGEPAFNITLSADKHLAQYDKNNFYVGGAITFTAVRQNIPGPNTYFAIYRVDNGQLQFADTPENAAAHTPQYFAGSGGDRFVMTADAVKDYIFAFGTIRVVAYRDGYAATDSVSIAKVKDGGDGASAITLVPHTETTVVDRNSVRNIGAAGWGGSAARSKETFSRGAVAQWTVPGTTTGNCMAGLAQITDSTSNSFDSITFAAFRQSDGYTDARVNGNSVAVGPNVGAGDARFMVQFDYGTGDVGFFVNGNRFHTYPWGKQPDPLCFRTALASAGAAVTDITLQPSAATGQSAYAVIMDNEAHVVPADPAGNVTSYAGAAFTFKVLYGGQDVTGSFGGNVGIAPGGNPQGLSVPGSWPSYSVNGGFDAGEDVAAVTLRFTGSGAHAGMVLDRTFSLTKSKAAVNGVSPPLIQVSATPQALRYDKDDQFAAGDVVFRATYQNATGPVSWASVIGHGIYNTPGVTISGDTLTISAARMRDVIAYNVSVGQPASETIIASVSGVSDRITVTKVRDGQNGNPGDPGVSPIQVSAQPEALTINLDASGTPLPGALPVTIGNTAIQGAANVPIASVTIVSVTGVTAFAVGTSAINVTATAGGNDGEIVYDVVAAGQTIRKRVGVTITRSGADGAVQQNIGITSPQISWSSYQQHGGTLAINASGSGKLELNLSGNMRAALGGYLQFYSKLQYRATGGTWTDVSGSERTSTISEEQFEPNRQTAANVNGAGPYPLTGLTPSGAYEVRAMTAKVGSFHSNSNTVSMSMSGKQVV